MWRALILAVGAYVALLGAEALAINKAVLKPEWVGEGKFAQRQDITPPDWAPWSLMGAGAVTVLYSFTIPRRIGSGS